MPDSPLLSAAKEQAHREVVDEVDKGVLERARSISVPECLIDPETDNAEEEAVQIIVDYWERLHEMWNDGRGYADLVSLRENLKGRIEEFYAAMEEGRGEPVPDAVEEIFPESPDVRRDIERIRTRKTKLLFQAREVLTFRLDVLENFLFKIEVFGEATELTEEEAGDMMPSTGPGRRPLYKQPEQVLETLELIVEWLDHDPPPDFVSRTGNGLANYVAENLGYITASGAGDRIEALFNQLEQHHPELPVPDLGTARNGQIYLDNAEAIGDLLDKYRERFVSKKVE